MDDDERPPGGCLGILLWLIGATIAGAAAGAGLAELWARITTQR